MRRCVMHQAAHVPGPSKLLKLAASDVVSGSFVFVIEAIFALPCLTRVGI